MLPKKLCHLWFTQHYTAKKQLPPHLHARAKEGDRKRGEWKSYHIRKKGQIECNKVVFQGSWWGPISLSSILRRQRKRKYELLVYSRMKIEWRPLKNAKASVFALIFGLWAFWLSNSINPKGVLQATSYMLWFDSKESVVKLGRKVSHRRTGLCVASFKVGSSLLYQESPRLSLLSISPLFLVLHRKKGRHDPGGYSNGCQTWRKKKVKVVP